MDIADIEIGKTYTAGNGDLNRTVHGIEETTEAQVARGLVAAAGVTVAIYTVPGPFAYTPYRQPLDIFAAWTVEEVPQVQGQTAA